MGLKYNLGALISTGMLLFLNVKLTRNTVKTLLLIRYCCSESGIVNVKDRPCYSEAVSVA